MNSVYLLAFVGLESIGLFSFLTVAAWANARRKEREAFYRSEVAKKLADLHGPEASLTYLRLDEVNRLRRTRDSLKLAGLITLAAGAAVVAIATVLAGGRGLWVLGLLPLLVGLALLVYVYGLAPPPPE